MSAAESLLLPPDAGVVPSGDPDSAVQTVAESVNVIVCRLGQGPIIEQLVADVSRSYLPAMQELVAGFVQCITLDDGLDLWCNEDGLAQGLVLNRCIPTVGRRIPGGFAFVIDATGGQGAGPGEAAEWRIHGDFFIARSTVNGELASVTDEDLAKYRQLFASEAA